MRKVLVSLLLLFCFFFTANINAEGIIQLIQQQSIVYPEFSTQSYASANEAAVNAILLSYKISNEIEYGGVIYLNPDMTYGFTFPKTNNQKDSVMIDHVSKPYGSRIVADYHTHPCLVWTHFPAFFSPQDIHSYRYYETDGYMGDFCTGRVNLFQLSTDIENNAVIGNETGYAVLTSGHLIGRIGLTKQPIVVEAKPEGDHVPDDLVETLLKM